MNWLLILTTWAIGSVLVGAGIVVRVLTRPVPQDEFEHWAADCPWPLDRTKQHGERQ